MKAWAVTPRVAPGGGVTVGGVVGRDKMAVLAMHSCGRFWRMSFVMVAQFAWMTDVKEFVRVVGAVGIEGRDVVVFVTKRDAWVVLCAVLCAVVGWGSALILRIRERERVEGVGLGALGRVGRKVGEWMG